MATAYSTLLGLALPVQGELSGTWGDMVDNGITRYVDIAVAGTVTLTNDGAVTLSLTNGDSSATNIVSSLTGAGTVSAQFAIIKVTGTLTTAKVLTPPSSSRTYVVVNAATGSTVTVKASGQTGVSIAVGETAFVYFNGTDYVKVAGTVDTGVTSFTAGTTGFTPSSATSGAVTLAGTLATTNGGTGLTSFTSGGVVYASSTSALTTGSALYFNGTNLAIGTTTVDERLRINGSTDATSRVRLYNQGTELGAVGSQLGYLGSGGANDLLLYGVSNTTIGTNGFVAFTAGGVSEQMRLTSTGLGIGTTSPQTKLQLVSTSSDVRLQLSNSSSTDNTTTYGGSIQLFTTGLYINNNQTSGDIIFRNSGFTERMRLTSAGNVGIGTSSPAVKLRVISSDADYISVFSNTNASGYGVQVVTQGSGTNLAFQVRPNVGNTDAFQVLDNGNVGIGTSSPAAILHTSISGSGEVGRFATTTDSTPFISIYSNGSIRTKLRGSSAETALLTQGALPLLLGTNDTERARISAAGGFSVGTTADPGAGAIYATGNITAYYSDARLKTVSGKIENALDKVAQLSGVYYTNNSVAKSFGYDSDEVQVGVLAQDVEAVLPQIVKAAPFDLDQDGNSKSGENYKTVQYERLVPLLIEAINELRAEVKALKGE